MVDLIENVTVKAGGTSFDWLKGLESPFAWRPGDYFYYAEKEDMVSHFISKADADLYNQRRFTFNRFILQLVVSYELYNCLGNSTAALSRLDRMELELGKLDIVSNDRLYREIRRAQWHAVLSSRAYILAFSGKPEQSKSVVTNNFDPVSALTSLEFGGLKGIKGAVYLQYGPKEAFEALSMAQEAVRASPKQAEWHLLVGKSMESLRRSKRNFTGIPEEELSHMELAAELNPEPHYALSLAKAYERLRVEGLARYDNDPSFNDTDLHGKLIGLGHRAMNIYWKVLQMPSQDTKTKLKCLESMLKCPLEFLNVTEVRVVLEEVSRTPNVSSRFYNVAGTFYLKVDKNTDKALQLFEKGEALRDYGCCMNALRLRVRRHEDLDVEQCLLQLAREFSYDPSGYEHALSHLGAFYIFRKRNVGLAVDTFNKILAQNPRSKAVLAHRPMFLRSTRPINMLAVLVNEVKRAEVVPLVAPADHHSQTKLWRTVGIHHPGLLNRNIDIYLVDRLLEKSIKKRTTQ